MSTRKVLLGRWGETVAAGYLERLGYTILERNVRTPYGEIDLVARQDPEKGRPAEAVTVFVEVKTRSSTAFGLPEEAVTARKRAHLLAAAQSYLQDHPTLEGAWRVDVVAIQRFRRGQAPAITHFENALC
jgi:putative endonuclease